MIFMICANFLFISSMLSRQPKCDTLQHTLRQIYPRCLMYPQSKSKIVKSFWIHSDIFDSTSNYVYWLFSEGRVSLTLQAASNQPGVSFQEARITFNAGQKPKVESSRKNINQYIGSMAFYLDFSRC